MYGIWDNCNIHGILDKEQDTYTKRIRFSLYLLVVGLDISDVVLWENKTKQNKKNNKKTKSNNKTKNKKLSITSKGFFSRCHSIRITNQTDL